MTRPGTPRQETTGPGAADGLAAAASGLGAAPGGLAGAERTAVEAGGPDTDAAGPGRGLGDPGRGLDGPGRGLGADTGEHSLPGSRMAARRGAERQVPTAFGELERGRRARGATTARPAGDDLLADDDRPAPRRAGRRGRKRNSMMAGLLLAPVLVVILLVGGYVYLNSRHAPAAPHANKPSHAAAALNSPAATLGPWKHIASRSLDSAPLTVTEVFPAKFSNNGAEGTLTVSKVSTKCSHEVLGTTLAAAVRKADCTQVLRASYLSTNRKIMATVGVLNLTDVSAAEKAGRAAGATEFIKQLASAHGPTRNIAKGTGIVEAEVKGHYLILTWTEFANLKAPSGKSQRQKLEAFSSGLVAGTANVSLTSRMVTGHPAGATTKS